MEEHTSSLAVLWSNRTLMSNGNMKGEWQNALDPLQGQLLALRLRWL